MAHSDETRALLRKHYVFDRLTLEQSARLADVPYRTAKRWKERAAEDGDDWDGVRTAATLAGGSVEQLSQQILTEMLVQFNAVLEMVKTDTEMPAQQRVELLSSLMDNIHKSLAALRRFMPEVNGLAVGMRIMRGLAEFIQERFPQHGAAFVEILEPFGDELPKLVADVK